MANCSCGSCLPPGGSGVNNSCDTIDEGQTLVVKDENCNYKGLTGTGVAFSNGDTVTMTDGSERSGLIKLNTPNAAAAGSILALDPQGNIVDLGDGAVEGQTLLYQGGRWIVSSQTDAKTVFDPLQLGIYSDDIASFGCGPEGTVRMGRLKRCASSLVFYDENQKIICLGMDALAKLLYTSLCSQATDWDGSACISGLMVCTPEGLRRVKPIGGKVLVGDVTNGSCWVMQDLNGTQAAGLKLVFKYTGATQYFTVPPNVGFMLLKIWGGGGSWDYGGASARGGLGGYTTVKYPVIPGQIYAVMVGQGPNNTAGFIYGFGGIQSADNHNHAGGGLSGVFTGANEILVTDSARAVAIAGGGGAGGATNTNQNLTSGGSGNASTSGGQATMKGINATSGQISGLGGGGGGYTGGGQTTRIGFGGAGFFSPLGTGGSIQFDSDGAPNNISDPPPNYTDADWDTTYQAAMSNKHGLVVVIFSVN